MNISFTKISKKVLLLESTQPKAGVVFVPQSASQPEVILE